MEIYLKKDNKNNPTAPFFWEIRDEKGKMLARSEFCEKYSECLREVVYVNLAAFTAKLFDATKNQPVRLSSPAILDLDELDLKDLGRFENTVDKIPDDLELIREGLSEPEPGVSLGDPE